MRRVCAAFLLAVFSFLLITPALFASDPEANLPPCCRRDGKHHCAMSSAMMAAMMRGAAAVPGFHAAKQTCPLYPGAASAAFQLSWVAILVATMLLVALLLRYAPRPVSTVRVPFFAASSCLLRGPPALLA